ncbi:MAG: hypothetical protein FJ225_04305 [Lentisphaerae bacterium]|nr:hypothetical protein [Lentisphaerota bacterium]
MTDMTGEEIELDLMPEAAPRGAGALAADTRDARAAMLADTLAWAVSHGIPLSEALRTVPVPEGRCGVMGLLAFCPSPVRRALLRVIPDGAFWRSQWPARLADLRLRLEAGATLSQALRGAARRYLPAYFLTGVDEAERQGRLPVALPVLAGRLRMPIGIARRQRAVWTFVFARLLAGLGVLNFVCVMIAPKFEEIFADLLEGRPMPAAMRLVQGGLLQAALLTALAALLIVRALGRMGRLGELVLLRIPGIAGERRRLCFYELARGMAAFTAQGEDIVAAAEWSARSTRSAWLRRRLRRFAAAVRGGAHWTEAWDRLYVGRPVERWIIRNAAAREEVAAGFDLLAEWLAEEMRRTGRLVRMCLEPVFTVLMGLVVGALAYALFAVIIEVSRGLV